MSGASSVRMLPAVLVSNHDGAITVGFAGLPDVDGGVVDVVPGKSGGFAGTQPEVEHEDPHRLKVGAFNGGEELSGLRGGERFGGALRCVGGGEFGEGGDVAGDKVAALGPGECLGQGLGISPLTGRWL